MKTAVKITFIISSLVYLIYVSLPLRQFPVPPPDALQSLEPADTETPLRRSYFTDLSREEIMTHYQNQMQLPIFNIFTIHLYRLNYPPEEAYTIIRDQTRSTFLEELVHPFRQSFFINGFEPKNDKDAIVIADKKWRQKITVKYVENTFMSRFGVGILTVSVVYIVFLFISKTIRNFKKIW